MPQSSIKGLTLKDISELEDRILENANSKIGSKGIFNTREENVIYSNMFDISSDAEDNQANFDKFVAAAATLSQTNPEKHYIMKLSPGVYKFSGNLTIPPNVSFDMTGAELQVTSSDRETPHFSIGGTVNIEGTNYQTSYRFFKGLKITRPYAVLLSRENKELDIGIHVNDMHNCVIEFVYIQGFRISMCLWPRSSYVGYNKFYLGEMHDFTYGVELRGGRTPAGILSGWVNANKFWGGHFQPRQASQGVAFGIVVSSQIGGYTKNNENVFYGPTFEMGNTIFTWQPGNQPIKTVVRGTAPCADGFYHAYEVQNSANPVVTAGNEPTHYNNEIVTKADGAIWKDLGPFRRSPVAFFGNGGGLKVDGARWESGYGGAIVSASSCGFVKNSWTSGMAVSVGQLVANNNGIYQVNSIGGVNSIGTSGTAGTSAPTQTTYTQGANGVVYGDTYTDSNNVVWEYIGVKSANSLTSYFEFNDKQNIQLDDIGTGGNLIIEDFTTSSLGIRDNRVTFFGMQQPDEIRFNDIHKRIIGSASGVVLNGGVARNAGSNTTLIDSLSSTSTIKLKKDAILFNSTSSILGFLIDAKYSKRFIVQVNSGKEAGLVGKLYIRAYDKDFNSLGYVSGSEIPTIALNLATGSIGNTKDAGATTYGIFAATTSEAQHIVGVSAAAAYLFVSLTQGDLNGITVRPLLNDPYKTVASKVEPFTTFDGLRYSKGTPTLGYFPIKEFIYNLTPASGQPMGWYVSTVGWLAPQWVTGTSYLINEIVINAGNAYQALAAGISGATAPTGTGASISDGTVNWKYVGVQAVLSSGVNNP